MGSRDDSGRGTHGFKNHCSLAHVYKQKASRTASKVNGVIMLFITFITIIIIVNFCHFVPLGKITFENSFSSVLTPPLAGVAKGNYWY